MRFPVFGGLLMLSVYEQRDCSRFLRATCLSLLVYAGVANVGTATADVSLPAIIGNNMVLQQQTETLIWGWAEPGERVRVTGDWLPAEVATAANDDGEWRDDQQQRERQLRGVCETRRGSFDFRLLGGGAVAGRCFGERQ